MVMPTLARDFEGEARETRTSTVTSGRIRAAFKPLR